MTNQKDRSKRITSHSFLHQTQLDLGIHQISQPELRPCFVFSISVPSLPTILEFVGGLIVWFGLALRDIYRINCIYCSLRDPNGPLLHAKSPLRHEMERHVVGNTDNLDLQPLSTRMSSRGRKTLDGVNKTSIRKPLANIWLHWRLQYPTNQKKDQGRFCFPSFGQKEVFLLRSGIPTLVRTGACRGLVIVKLLEPAGT